MLFSPRAPLLCLTAPFITEGCCCEWLCCHVASLPVALHHCVAGSAQSAFGVSLNTKSLKSCCILDFRMFIVYFVIIIHLSFGCIVFGKWTYVLLCVDNIQHGVHSSVACCRRGLPPAGSELDTPSSESQHLPSSVSTCHVVPPPAPRPLVLSPLCGHSGHFKMNRKVPLMLP